MGSLERRIEDSHATPQRISDLVSMLPSVTVKAPRQISKRLISRLGEIAAKHEGLVPLHGRLFAQWMHHAYPLECPFPHALGTTSPLTRSEWMKESGEVSSRASNKEMNDHISTDRCRVLATGKAHCDKGEESDAELPWS